jgi:small subunit ribosomal protein S6
MDRRRYELYTVLMTGLEEDTFDDLTQRIEGYVTTNGGEILEQRRKGRRRLAYPINHNSDGFDIIYQVMLPAEAPMQIERQLRLNENVLRYLLVRREDLDKARPEQAKKES